MLKISIKRIRMVGVLLFLVWLIGCQSEQDHQTTVESGEKGKVMIGAKSFTEQSILLKITAIYLSEHGYEVEEITDMKSKDLRSSLEQRNIDLYWEYTGTALMLYLDQESESNPKKAYEKVKALDRQNDIYWLKQSKFNNTYTILVKKEFSKEHGITSISDLAEFINDGGELKFASETEFYDRNDGLKGLERTYQFDLPSEDVVRLESKLTYNALKNGTVDAIVGFVTDGKIQKYNLERLNDDRSFFPAYNAVPVMNKEFLDRHEEIAHLLNHITDRLDTETMIQLNYDVDIENKDIFQVSRQWLEEEGLLYE